MADIVLFHHAQGLTSGVRAFAARLEAHGHRVTTPDLYDGRTFDTLEAGVAHAESIGMAALADLGVAAADPAATVFAGFSLGVFPAQKLATTRPGAQAALLCHGAIALEHLTPTWPADVAAQFHIAESDPWGDLDVARDLVKQIPAAELFVYPGSAHLTTDDSLPGYEEETTDNILRRSLAMLDRLG